MFGFWVRWGEGKGEGRLWLVTVGMMDWIVVYSYIGRKGICLYKLHLKGTYRWCGFQLVLFRCVKPCEKKNPSSIRFSTRLFFQTRFVVVES